MIMIITWLLSYILFICIPRSTICTLTLLGNTWHYSGHKQTICTTKVMLLSYWYDIPFKSIFSRNSFLANDFAIARAPSLLISSYPRYSSWKKNIYKTMIITASRHTVDEIYVGFSLFVCLFACWNFFLICRVIEVGVCVPNLGPKQFTMIKIRKHWQ